MGLFFLGQGSNVVLEGVRNPFVVEADVRDALVLVPVVLVG